MTAAEALLVLATGFGAGVLSSTVGVASLLSFPVLVALGLPPVVANVSNTLGLIPGGLGGVLGYRREVRQAGPIARTIVIVCALGAMLGAALLLARLMDEIGDLIKETRLESLGQPGRPQDSLAGHRAIAEAIRAGDPAAAAEAMHAHVAMVSDVALLREER